MLRQTFEVELATPCFLGGAKDQAEWRGASIRGQLRWWFRAVAGAGFGGDLEKVRWAEEEIFGSTGRSSALRVVPGRGPEPERPGGNEVPFGESLDETELAERWKDRSNGTRSRLRLGARASDPLHYLAYGPVTHGALVRPFLPSRTPVSFDLKWIRRPSPENDALFEKALWGWLFLGGIGARSRKGFGSLHLRSARSNGEEPIVSWSAPVAKKDFQAEVSDLLKLGKRLKHPEWTCLSEGSRVCVGKEGFPEGEDALSRLGGWLVAFRRRYGKSSDGRSYGGQPVANRDYEWAAPNGSQPRQGIPDRSGFGLPLPFTRRVDGVMLGETVVWGNERDPRRASPLLLHVARFGSRYFPVLTYLPARFLPVGAELGFKGVSSPNPPPQPPRPGIVGHFLDDLIQKELVDEIGAAS